ncbi:uncharacterized protein G2W53_019988 [Senna tora]|uniref:Uncharacterized protein n=1 Tax=Senna tora TaxID=362788 RepID=A0A834U2R8_9FABA|nr:uncharacterized protein G2W53_019988 [Senna tora]
MGLEELKKRVGDRDIFHAKKTAAHGAQPKASNACHFPHMCFWGPHILSTLHA